MNGEVETIPNPAGASSRFKVISRLLYQGSDVSEGWIIFGLCLLTLIGATLPILHDRSGQRDRPKPPPPSKNPPNPHD